MAAGDSVQEIKIFWLDLSPFATIPKPFFRGFLWVSLRLAFSREWGSPNPYISNQDISEWHFSAHGAV